MGHPPWSLAEGDRLIRGSFSHGDHQPRVGSEVSEKKAKVKKSKSFVLKSLTAKDQKIARVQFEWG